MSNWENLRKHARRLENEIDQKLVSFSKLGVNPSTGYRNEDSDTEPLLSGEDTLDKMSQEIEKLLSELSDVNEKLTDSSGSNESTGSSTREHVLQRHHDIFQDYSQEFRKTSANLKARRERDQLLYSVRKDIDAYKHSTGLNRRADLYMKENDQIRSADKMVTDQINIAIETRENLVSQRHNFKRIQTRLHDLSNRFPLVNNLMQKIHNRRRRDSIIIGFVAATCLFFMLTYIFQ